MSIIGTFTYTKDGGWSGNIRTLTLDLKARFVPNDNQMSPSAPAFRVFSGQSEIGAAWRAQADGDSGKDYLNVSLDDPCFPSAIRAALFENAEKQSAQLIWTRRRND